jgi:hypothetical protein
VQYSLAPTSRTTSTRSSCCYFISQRPTPGSTTETTPHLVHANAGDIRRSRVRDLVTPCHLTLPDSPVSSLQKIAPLVPFYSENVIGIWFMPPSAWLLDPPQSAPKSTSTLPISTILLALCFPSKESSAQTLCRPHCSRLFMCRPSSPT